jgi:very-short-patch-repair endonuclease
VLDFYCHRLKFAIEVDGAWHTEIVASDEARTAELATYGITIMRITNAEIRDEWASLEDRILATISVIPGPSPVASRHPLPEGEG